MNIGSEAVLMVYNLIQEVDVEDMNNLDTMIA